MKTWKRLFGRKKSASLTPGLGGGFIPFSGGSNLGSIAKQLAAYNGWVYSAVNAIARRVSSVDLRLYAKRLRLGRPVMEEVFEHPCLDLLRRPNPIQSGRVFIHMVQTHLDLTGMAFIRIVHNALGRPAELWPVPPDRLRRIVTGTTNQDAIRAFVFDAAAGKALEVRAEDVIYLRYPHPSSLVYGASPIQAQAYAYDIDLAIRTYERNFFQNSARPDLILYTDQRLSPEDAKRVLMSWKQKHQGAERAFEPAILDSGLKASPLSVSAKDFEFTALAGWTKDNILAAYNVPEGKLGLVKDVNRANAHGIDVTFNSECIKPRLDLWDETLTTYLLPRWDVGLTLSHDNPVPRDVEFEHQKTCDLLDRGVITVNEVRTQNLGRGLVGWGELPRVGQPVRPEKEPGGREARNGPAAGVKQCLIDAALENWNRIEGRFHGWSKKRLDEFFSRGPDFFERLLPSDETLYRQVAVGYGPGEATDVAGLIARLKSQITTALQGAVTEGLTKDEALARLEADLDAPVAILEGE